MNYNDIFKKMPKDKIEYLIENEINDFENDRLRALIDEAISRQIDIKNIFVEINNDYKSISPKDRINFSSRLSAYNPDNPIVIISVKGKYEEGAQGRYDCDFIESKIKQDLEWISEKYPSLIDHLKVILDLSKFVYNWGDDFVDVLDFFSFKNEYLIVYGPRCKKGISTLIAWGNSSDVEDLKELDGYVESIDKAIYKLRDGIPPIL